MGEANPIEWDMGSTLISNWIWVGSWRCGWFVTCFFFYQLFAKPGNKAVSPPWSNPYDEWLLGHLPLGFPWRAVQQFHCGHCDNGYYKRYYSQGGAKESCVIVKVKVESKKFGLLSHGGCSGIRKTEKCLPRGFILGIHWWIFITPSHW